MSDHPTTPTTKWRPVPARIMLALGFLSLSAVAFGQMVATGSAERRANGWKEIARQWEDTARRQEEVIKEHSEAMTNLMQADARLKEASGRLMAACRL
jgi:hypothetical protein